MTNEPGPRAELRKLVEDITDEQVRTMLNWTGMFSRDRDTVARDHSMGTLGDALGIISEAQEPGRSRMRLEVDPLWHNPNGVLHGGVIYAMVDYGMGGAVMASLPKGEFCTTIEVKINYLAAVREGTLTCETEAVRLGRNIAFLESKVTDQNGKLVATGSGSMFILRPNAT